MVNTRSPTPTVGGSGGGGGGSNGNTVSTSRSAAIASLVAAADRGDAEAAFELGVRYDDGADGLDENAPEAARLFRVAAERGHAAAERRCESCAQPTSRVQPAHSHVVHVIPSLDYAR
jgi:hypothetical protein